MDQAPIDIRYSELLQWLEDRYQIPKDWPKRYELISAKKREIIDMFFQNDTPEMKKLQTTFKTYNQVPLESLSFTEFQKLNAQLIKTEAAKDKSLLRNYNHPLIYSSYVLNNIYIKNNMHLAESSKIIIQIVAYDIPICSKTIADINRTIQENNGKSAEKEEQIKRNTKKVLSILKSNDISSDIETTPVNKIALSLIDRITINDEFDNKLKEIEERIKGNSKIKQAIDMYYDFYKAVNSTVVDDPHLTDRLLRMFNEGDYSLNRKKEKVDRKKIIQSKADEYRLKYADQGDTKGWNFTLVNDNNASSSTTTTSQSITNKEGDNMLSDSCLLNNKERDFLLADLHEVLIFLQERISNSDNTDEINLMMYEKSFKNFNLKYTIEDMKDDMIIIQEVIALLESKDFIFLATLYNDEETIKNIINTYSELKIQNSKLKNMIAELRNKNEELEVDIKENEKKIFDYRKNVIALRKSTEIFLTKTLKRKITIMGDENLISK